MITLPPINLLSLLPAIIPTITGILILCWDLGMKDEERPRLAWLGILGLIITAVVSFCLHGRNELAFNGAIALDSYGLFFNLVFCLAGILTLLMSVSYLNTIGLHVGEYYSLTLFAIVGMIVMAAAADLITIFIGLETMSIAVYVLAGIWRQRLQSNEAALKYFLLGAFASGFLLYGIALIYGATGSIQLSKIALYVNEHGGSTMLLVGIAMLIVGFGFKVAAVPFHAWTPDVYEGAPTTVTAFMAVGVKAAAFAAFARVFLHALGALHAQWEGIFWVLAVLTMTVGNITAIVQNNVKRMLAYSSIAHAGYLLVAMVAGKELGGAALMYYLVAYGLMNLGAFGVIVAVGRKGEPNEEYADFSGLGFRYPLLGLAMTVFMLSLTGIPPLVGFAGKFYVFSAAVKAGYLWLAVIGVLNSAISAYYYIRVVVHMYMYEGDKMPEKLSARPALALAILIAATGTVLLGVFPSASIAFARVSFLSLG